MNEILYWLGNNKKMLIIFAAFVVVAFGAGAVRCSRVNAAYEAEQRAAEAEQAEEAAEDSITATEDVALLDAGSIRAAYDDTELEIVGLLSSNVWTDKDETSVLRFTQDAFSEGSNGTQAVHPFVITAYEVLPEREVEGGVVRTVKAAVSTDAASEIVTVARTVNAKGVTTAATVDSAIFSHATRYIMRAAAGTCEVIGPDESWYSGYGVEEASVDSLIVEYCAKNYPTATKATWSKKVTVDYAEATVRTSFVLDNKAASTIAIVISTADGSVQIERR